MQHCHADATKKDVFQIREALAMTQDSLQVDLKTVRGSLAECQMDLAGMLLPDLDAKENPLVLWW